MLTSLVFTGDTLLAIRAPSGTRLEVPIPEGLNGQKKYQIHLKSTSGPIDVLLVNKDAWSSPPVVLPVPPPEDLIQCQAVAPSKPQIPPLTHFQEASVPSSTQPSTPTPTSTQDHSPPAPGSQWNCVWNHAELSGQHVLPLGNSCSV
uniref:E2F transcription factor CC-MB domain-containing protein n=1 Tax=Buteo japonicus TaxID=224669 RepID=A0A8B9ZEF1_9AVES